MEIMIIRSRKNHKGYFKNLNYLLPMIYSLTIKILKRDLLGASVMMFFPRKRPIRIKLFFFIIISLLQEIHASNFDEILIDEKELESPRSHLDNDRDSNDREIKTDFDENLDFFYDNLNKLGKREYLINSRVLEDLGEKSEAIINTIVDYNLIDEASFHQVHHLIYSLWLAEDQGESILDLMDEYDLFDVLYGDVLQSSETINILYYLKEKREKALQIMDSKGLIKKDNFCENLRNLFDESGEFKDEVLN